MKMAEYVAYYRVSTDKQGIKGLGMDAQRKAVARFMAGKGELAAAFVEVESGRKNYRPQLLAALAE
jgi:DNA invertase Pin-like site-specific DNA recombinase